MKYLQNQDRDIGGDFEMYIGISCFAIAGVVSGLTYLVTGQILKDEVSINHH